MDKTVQDVHRSKTVIDCVRRRLFMVLLTAIAAFVGVSCIILNLEPLYLAKTTLILPYTPKYELTSRNDMVSSPQSDPLIVHSYIQILQDDGLCLQVIRQLHLAEMRAFNAPPSFLSSLVETITFGESAVANGAAAKEDRVLRLYKKRLKIDGGRSLAVDLTFQSESPALAAAVVNAHAEAYQTTQVQYRRQEIAVKASWMQEQVTKSAADLRAAEVAIQLHQGSFRINPSMAANESSELKFLQSILSSKQSIYEGLLQRQQIMLAEQHYSGSDTRVLSPARPAIHPIFPNIPIFEGIAAIVSGLFGVGLAWLSELLASQRSETVDRLRAIGIELLARVEIPRQWRYLRPGRQKLRLAVFWEQIREARSSLPTSQKKGRVLAVTSAAPKQSTSLVAAALARAFAASGTPTLLIDLNFRHPSAHSFFADTAHLSDELQTCPTGEQDLERAVHQVASSLWLLPIASRKDVSVDVLAGPATRTMLANLRRKYSVIVVDTPPVGVLCDSLVIANLADDIVLVADDDALDLEALERATHGLRGRSGAIRGAILTTRRQTSVNAYRRLGDFARDSKLSAEWPRPWPAKKKRETAALPEPGVLQPAE